MPRVTVELAPSLRQGVVPPESGHRYWHRAPVAPVSLARWPYILLPAQILREEAFAQLGPRHPQQTGWPVREQCTSTS